MNQASNNSQLMALVRKGMSVEDAAAALELDIDVAKMSVGSIRKEKFSLADMIEEAKPTAVRVLIDVLENPDAENKDKIAAAKIILQGEGVLPEINANAFSERVRRMREAIDIEEVEFSPHNRLQLVG